MQSQKIFLEGQDDYSKNLMHKGKKKKKKNLIYKLTLLIKVVSLVPSGY